MTNLEMVGGASAIAVVMGLVEVAKWLGLNKKYCPILSVALGILISLGYYFYNQKTWYEAVIVGLIIGLSAVGLYSGTRETAEMIACRKEIKNNNTTV